MDENKFKKMKQWVYKQVRDEIYAEIKELEEDDIRNEIENNILEELRVAWEKELRVTLTKEIEDVIAHEHELRQENETIKILKRDQNIIDKAIEQIKNDLINDEDKIKRYTFRILK